MYIFKMSLKNIFVELLSYLWGQWVNVWLITPVAPGNDTSVAVLHLTHWGWMMHICVSKLNIIGSDNDLSPGQCQAIIWTNAEILLIWPLQTNFSEILIKIHIFSFKKMQFKSLFVKWLPFWLGLSALRQWTEHNVIWSALNEALFDIIQMLAYLVHNIMSRFGHFACLLLFLILILIFFFWGGGEGVYIYMIFCRVIMKLYTTD